MTKPRKRRTVSVELAPSEATALFRWTAPYVLVAASVPALNHARRKLERALRRKTK